MIDKKPSVYIYMKNPYPGFLEEICAGIEEEGLLYTVLEQEGTLDSLAFHAANDSPLGVGIGLLGKGVALKVRLQAEGDNLFFYREADKEQCRMLGANSARVIKKVPFRMEREETLSQEGEEKETKEAGRSEMSIYTRKGDQGNTTLLKGEPVKKYDIRVELLGSMDELNSLLGVLKSQEEGQELKKFFERIQRNLMQIMAGVADQNQGAYTFSARETQALEELIDRMEAAFPRKKEFILPGASFYTAQIDVCRTVVRRCERRFAQVAEEYSADSAAQMYLNRLSDYLYVLARYKEYEG